MSQYAREINRILASLHEQGDEDATPLPEEEDLDTIHVYPVEGGGLLLTRTPLEEQDAAASPVVDSQPTPRRATRTPSPFVLFLLLLALLVGLDMADSQLVALLTPTVTIAITPVVHTLTLHSSAPVGKLLSPITLSESETVAATGHGHQEARAATGTLTFYNTSFTAQTVAAGTILTGGDGEQIVTLSSIAIPANSPPADGQATVGAQTREVGARGNIPALDVNGLFSSTLYVRNLTAFSGGRDARDFLVVASADQDHAVASLQAKVAASMSAALQQQLIPAEVLHRLPCSPTLNVDHPVGAEAPALTVTVSETCTAVAYDGQEVQDTATRLLMAQAARTFGAAYTLVGPVQVSITNAITKAISPKAMLAFTGTGTVAYLLTQEAQQHLKALLVGKPRLEALRWLLQQPGIHTASITGIADNQPLPDDLGHIHLLLVVLLF